MAQPDRKDEQGDADQTHLRGRAATDNRRYGGFRIHRQDLGVPPRQRMWSLPLPLLSQEGRVVFPISTERHAIPRGDPFADIGVIILIEIDQIDFLALCDESPENVQRFHSGITG